MMAEASNDRLLVPSVLDRLLDENPGAVRDTPRTRGQVLREIKQSVRRDLENLLNTRARASIATDQLDPELRKSLAAYGLPDLTCVDAQSSIRKQEYEQTLREVIERFEPRLRKVRITLIEKGNQADRVLRFRIQADLRIEPFFEPVTFQSLLEPSTGSVQVQGEGE